VRQQEGEDARVALLEEELWLLISSFARYSDETRGELATFMPPARCYG
jgi:hypothetical protein